MRNRHVWGIALAVIGSVAGLALCFATFTTIRNHEFDMALGLVIVCGVTLVQLLHRAPADKAYEAGYDLGESRGWTEGRRFGRPVVVPLLRCPDCASPLDREPDRSRHQRRTAGQAVGVRTGR